MFQKLLSKQKQKSNNERQQMVNSSDVLKLITSILEGNYKSISQEEIGNTEIVEKWNQMLKILCENKKNNLLEINSLLQAVIRMDSISDMVKSVGKQTEALHTIASNSEQLTASIEEVASNSQQMSESASDVQQISEDGVNNITESIEFVTKSFDEIAQINVQMHNLKEKTDAINQIVDIVKGIADQTNLLSLNAAIEAARAGEQGRGFAVVADEVRKLSEHTKISVDDIQKNVSALQKDLDNSVDRISDTVAHLDSGKQLVNSALSSINLIGTSIGTLNNAIVQVAANTQEQTAVTQTFSGEILSLSSQADYLANSCKTTGSAIYDISKEINSIRLNMVKNRHGMSDADMMDIYITDHLLWKWRVYNMILGYEKIDTNVVGDHNNCGLGKWYYSLNNSKVKDKKVFSDIEQPHKELHKIAKEAALAYENNDIFKAEDALRRVELCSNTVINNLTEIARLLR